MSVEFNNQTFENDEAAFEAYKDALGDEALGHYGDAAVWAGFPPGTAYMYPEGLMESPPDHGPIEQLTDILESQLGPQPGAKPSLSDSFNNDPSAENNYKFDLGL